MGLERIKVVALTALIVAGLACGPREEPLVEVGRGTATGIDVVLLAPTDSLRQTRNYCTLEFRAAGDRHLVDVGTVNVRTMMTMEGEPMTGFVTSPKRVAPGRYQVEMVIAMAGAWQIVVEWDGPAGIGHAMLPAVVR